MRSVYHQSQLWASNVPSSQKSSSIVELMPGQSFGNQDHQLTSKHFIWLQKRTFVWKKIPRLIWWRLVRSRWLGIHESALLQQGLNQSHFGVCEFALSLPLSLHSSLFSPLSSLSKAQTHIPLPLSLFLKPIHESVRVLVSICVRMCACVCVLERKREREREREGCRVTVPYSWEAIHLHSEKQTLNFWIGVTDSGSETWVEKSDTDIGFVIRWKLSCSLLIK